MDVAMEGLENMAFMAMGVSLVTYFFGYMNFSLTKSANTLTNVFGSVFLLALFGGFISDTYLSRFKTIVLFVSMEILVSPFYRFFPYIKFYFGHINMSYH